MKLYARSLLSAAATALALAVTQPAMADDTRGPAPTVEALQADSGPFAVATYKISPSSALWYGYRGATVYYPKDTGQRFGVVTFTPGYTALQAVYAPLAERIASHGFVVVNIDTFTVYDQPAQRATEMAGALKQVIALARKGSVPYAGSIDDTRRAVVGHSMGGGGTLIEAAADGTLKAAVAFTPWSQARKSFSADHVPTMIVACEQDTVAVNSQHSDVFYASLPDTLPRSEVEVQGAGHGCATAGGSARAQTAVVKAAVSWLKLYVDGDDRYLPFVKGDINVGDYSRYDVKGF